MLLTDSYIHYRRNILISIILSEVIIISAFIFSPKKSFQDEKIIYDEPFILIKDIPQTVQDQPAQIQKPDIPPIYIPDQVEAFKLLEDVSLSQEISGLTHNISGEVADLNDIRSIRSMPRLLFEVVPAVGDRDFKGTLQLSLKINKNGRVVDHRVLFNSLDCIDCLNDIIKAAYRSKWEPAIVNGKNADYWIVKSYSFN